MSKYKAKWSILKAENNGVITLKDKKVICDSSMSKRKYEKSIAFFGDIQNNINNAKGKLSKEIKVLTITDVQFGKMNKTTDKDWWDAAIEVATENQKKEIYTIK